MDMKFPGSARTIIKSRIRNHKGREALIGDDPAKITNASVADLSQFATLLGLEQPTDAEIRAYDTAKTKGLTSGEAMDAVNALALASQIGGSGMHEITPPPADLIDAAREGFKNATDTQPGAPTDVEAADDDADADAADSETHVKASETVNRLQAMMGQGDFVGFQTELKALAIQAHTPPPAPRVITRVAADPAKIKGTVPQIVETKTMKAAGIKAMAYATDAATKLDVYDAADAPAIDTEYVWSDYTAPALAALAQSANVFLTGPAGTGKTTFAKQIAARFGRPFVRISCNDQTDAPTLIGMPALEDGSTTWEDGQLSAAIRRPGTVILIDEPSAARPGALMVLQAVLDADRTLQIPDTGEIVPVAEGVLFLAADNTAGTGDEKGAYEGTRVMNRATLDRFDLTIPIDYLPPDRESSLLVSRTGMNKKHASVLCKLAALTRRNADNGDLTHGMGFRRLEALGRQIAAGVDPAAAFNLAVLQTAPYDDREPLRQLWTSEINSRSFA